MLIQWPKSLFSRTILKVLESPIFIAGLGAFWLVISTLSEPFSMDEARWAYLARLWVRHGAPPYTRVLENKTPGIYYLFAISDLWLHSEQWFPRLVGILCILGASLLLFQIGKHWKDKASGLIAMIIFLFANAWTSFDGPLPSQTESFMTFFSVLAFYYAMSPPASLTNDIQKLIVAGFFMGWAVNFKQIAVTSMIALSLFVFLYRNEEINEFSQCWKNLFWLGTGILLAIGSSLVPLYANGLSLHDYIEGSWLLLFRPGDWSLRSTNPYLNPGSSAQWSVHLQRFPSTLTRPDTILFAICFLYLWKKRKSLEDQQMPAIGLLIWMVCDAVGVHASGYYFPHQFKQILPSLSLAAGLSLSLFAEDLSVKIGIKKKTYIFTTACILILGMTCSAQMPSINRAITQIQHPIPSQEEIVGRWIRAHTNADDFIYSFGITAHVVLFFSDRVSSSRYYNYFYINSSNVHEVSQDLMVKRPPIFIILQDNKAPDWLWKVIQSGYHYRSEMSQFWIYSRSIPQ